MVIEVRTKFSFSIARTARCYNTPMDTGSGRRNYRARLAFAPVDGPFEVLLLAMKSACFLIGVMVKRDQGGVALAGAQRGVLSRRCTCNMKDRPPSWGPCRAVKGAAMGRSGRSGAEMPAVAPGWPLEGRTRARGSRKGMLEGPEWSSSRRWRGPAVKRTSEGGEWAWGQWPRVRRGE